MSKAILEFNLPEENCEHKIAVNAMDFALSLLDIDQQVRNWLKYGNEFKSADEALEKTRDLLWTILENRNISLDMIE